MFDKNKGGSEDSKAWALLEKVSTASIAEQRRTRRWGILFKSLTFIYLFILLGLAFPQQEAMMLGDTKSPHTALVRLEGVIAAEEEANADAVVTGLREAFEAEQSRAVLLAINSPGGSPVQSGYIYDEIKRLRALHADKKVYAVISDLGASGAYYVAAAADEIYADKASLVGSIGVVASSFGFVGAMEKMGVERRAFSAGEHKNFLDPFQPLVESEREFWQEVLDTTHRQFIQQVQLGRGDRLADDDELFTGLVWSGEQALELGLVDGLGSPGHVAREVIGEENMVDYSMQLHPLDRLIREMGASFGQGLATLFGKTGISLR
jgi:protease-4